MQEHKQRLCAPPPPILPAGQTFVQGIEGKVAQAFLSELLWPSGLEAQQCGTPPSSCAFLWVPPSPPPFGSRRHSGELAVWLCLLGPEIDFALLGTLGYLSLETGQCR